MAEETLVGYQAARARAFLKRTGNNWIRKRVWDWEFKHGKWDYLQSHTLDWFYEQLIARLKGGSLLDLGCGNGGVRCSIPIGEMGRYVGVDYSAEATAQLQKRAAELPPLTDGQLLLVGDMTDRDLLTRTGGAFEVVLLHESLNYVAIADVPDYLRRLCELLSDGGVVMIRIWERTRYADYVEAVRSTLHVVAEVLPESSSTILLIADGPMSLQ